MNQRCNRRKHLWRLGLILIAASSTGCSSREDGPPEGNEAYAASGGADGDQAAQKQPLPQIPGEPNQLPARSQVPANSEAAKPIADVRPTPSPSSTAMSAAARSAARPDWPSESGKPPLSTGQADPQRKLADDLTPEQLMKVLAGADQDMQVIVSGRSGIEDPEEARDTLIQIIQMKLQAARRLAVDPDATATMKSEGARGELQALSHLAALGDLKSAEALELLATENLSSDDPNLVSDARLVTIGFAIERLQNGKENAAAEIVSNVKELSANASDDDVPALMVMGEARDMLARYGYETESKVVRDAIIDLFADASDASIAQMAAQVAGNVQFDEIETLRAKIIAGEDAPADDWKESVETLIDESADLQTVQYLAGSALEFESLGLTDLVDTTYEVLRRRFADSASATGREVGLAMDARQARQDVIGETFDPDLPSVDGQPLDIQDYRGKVVLMPFWATSFTESLQIVPTLLEIQEANPEDVAIVGMNLDLASAPVQEFTRENNLGFPNYRAESSQTEKVANPVAARFGLVSMPFVAILDREGRVSALDFTGRGLRQTVAGLITLGNTE